MKDYSHLGIISISDQANMLGALLADWVDQNGGTVEVVANVRHLWEKVYSRAVDTKPGVYICFVSEIARGPDNQRNDIHRCDRNWQVVVMRGHGFRNKIAKDDAGGGPAQKDDFYTVCEQIRDRIRIIKSIANEFPLEYKSMQPLPGVANPQMANVFCDGYAIQFSTANDVGEVTEGTGEDAIP